MTTIRFNEVGVSARRSGRCTVCGKHRKRSPRFWQTLSLFNRKADGAVKTKDDILAELRSELFAWRERPFVCATCEKAQTR